MRPESHSPRVPPLCGALSLHSLLCQHPGVRVLLAAVEPTVLGSSAGHSWGWHHPARPGTRTAVLRPGHCLWVTGPPGCSPTQVCAGTADQGSGPNTESAHTRTHTHGPTQLGRCRGSCSVTRVSGEQRPWLELLTAASLSDLILLRPWVLGQGSPNLNGSLGGVSGGKREWLQWPFC